MSKSPPSLKPALSKAAIAGAVLAVFGIVLFAVLWVILGNAGLSQTPRLFAALCIPPGVIAAIIGVYILVARPYASRNAQAATKEADQKQTEPRQ